MKFSVRGYETMFLLVPCKSWAVLIPNDKTAGVKVFSA